MNILSHTEPPAYPRRNPASIAGASHSSLPPFATQEVSDNHSRSVPPPAVQKSPERLPSPTKPEFTQAQIDDILTKRYEMNKLKSYDPWGRPGNGAPVADNHKRKFMEQDLKEELKPTNIGGMQFNTPGGGAPLRTPSGRLRTEVSGSEDIRHNATTRGRDPVETFRYRKDQDTIAEYRSDLERIQREQAAAQEQQRYNDFKADLASMQYDAFGRPGGGAPNTQTNYGSMNASRQEDYSYEPWGQGFGSPRRDRFGNVYRYRYHDKQEGNMVHPNDITNTFRTRIDPKETTLGMGPMRGHGAPLAHEKTGEPKTKLVTTLDKRNGERVVLEDFPGGPKRYIEDNIFHPFGTPGGGNPNYDKNGNRIAIIPGPSTVNRDTEEERRKQLAAQQYNRELERGILERELNKRKEMQTIRSPTENLADRIYAGQIGKPKRDRFTGQLVDQHISSTDVTQFSNISPRHDFAYMQQQSGAQHEYYTELERQCEARKLRNKLERNRDDWEAKVHHENFYRIFGHGNPGDNLKKQNFLKNLYHPDAVKNEYKKEVVVPSDRESPKFVKNNIGSYHATAYEMPNRNSRNDNYYVRPPYASHTE